MTDGPRCLVVIQARMGSTRFPGKSLAPLAAAPSLGHLLNAVAQVAAKPDTVIATSREPQDDAIAAFARSRGIECLRGDEANVASRFRDAAERWQPEWMARLSGDSPLWDYRALERALAVASPGVDVVSTVVSRRYPAGMNVELIRAATFLAAYPHFTETGHFEHVTPWFYQHPERYRIVAAPGGIDHAGRYRFAFDSEEDRRRLEQLFTQLGDRHWEHDLAAKCAAYDLAGVRA